jgi:plastocyanin
MRALHTTRFRFFCARLGVLCLFAARAAAPAQPAPVIAKVEVVQHNAAKAPPAAGAQDYSNVAVWLTPLDASNGTYDTVSASTRALATHQSLQLVQRNKSFDPHVLMIQMGSTVQFPNKDPFFHNVFSLFDGKRFDLGLYEGGSSNSARFDRPGVSFLFCNIHPEMSAIVVVVDTPYFAVSDHTGRVVFANVPDGRYLMHVWYERSSTEDLKTLERVITISDSSRSLETVQVIDSGDFKLTHKNKYGQDYTPQTTPAYKRP